ncbi:agamous-like MADS-box protein AGL61 [Lycium barbarum]|uniref:agamous-like MADS-box protein AGL61 n=1 Tax=Lycium barbarum TaxID=112863 RepID=UPI00293E36DD|nr:agamous-like MADS-box protein AGL61 [Lycium barbarum]
MEGKQTAGRKKIPLAKIEKEADLYSTFSKRRKSLYKKASEIVRECDVDMGIVLSSPAGKPFSFISPTPKAVIDRFMNPTIELSEGEKLVAANARNNINQNNDRLLEFDTREKAAKNKMFSLEQMNKTRDKGWWESPDQFSADDMINFEIWLNIAELQLENGASSSSQPPPQDPTTSAS